MAATMKIDGRPISEADPCYVIAEIGHNHQGSVDTCKKLFSAAKEAGAHAVKLQKRDNKSLFTKAMFDQPYDNENSYGPTYGLHREALEFGRDEYVELQRYAKTLGVTFFATAFDIPSADFLASLDVPAFKIASGDLKSLPLIEHVARFGKPMIISTGGGSLADVERMYEAVAPINAQLAILQCTAAYPPAFEDLNLSVISAFRQRFPDATIGFSGHDSGIAMSLVAYILGARIIEKHFTLNRAMKGTDHSFSLEPAGMRKLVRDLERARVALGDGVKRPLPHEHAPLRKMGKKLVAARRLPAGTRLTTSDFAMKSPGDGLPPYELDRLIGATLLRALEPDEAVSLDDIRLPDGPRIEV